MKIIAESLGNGNGNSNGWPRKLSETISTKDGKRLARLSDTRMAQRFETLKSLRLAVGESIIDIGCALAFSVKAWRDCRTDEPNYRFRYSSRPCPHG